MRAVALRKVVFLAVMAATAAYGDIPSSEHAALIAFYNSTGGSGWTIHTNWSGASGTECPQSVGGGWFGVVCDGIQSHVAGIVLPNNNLTGSLPSLTGFPNLQNFDVDTNAITGSIPTTLNSLTDLQSFSVFNNQLTGNIPSLTGMNALQNFDVDTNQLNGSIPSLTGLSNLQAFTVHDNQLTGSIPSLSTLINLNTFSVFNNQLSGSFPNLTGLASLQYFYVDSNQLSGSLPATLNTIAPALINFGAGSNQFTGAVPAIAGMTSLQQFDVHGNRLSGTIPTLTSLPSLGLLYLNNNALSGIIPSTLSALSNLQAVKLGGNVLTGSVPTAPANLSAGQSTLCTNNLQTTASPNDNAWNLATGLTHWYGTPFPNNKCDDIFFNGFQPSK